jgi:Fe-coproporphyrin III synthase
LRPSLSTNGTLVTRDVAARLKESGIAYVGVSIDGAAETHDAFRNRRGAFAEALAGIANAAAAGLRTGVRFTLNRRNAADLSAVLNVVENEGIGRFCMYHLVYAGRGASMRGDDVSKGQSRAAVELLIEKALDWSSHGIDTEILTTDNHADGALVLRYIERALPDRALEARVLLEMAGGCSAGRKFACVGSDGSVYPCQFWRHESLGNVRESRLSTLWRRGASSLIDALKDMPALLSGRRCAVCQYRAICGGCRIRALAATGDAWGDDPQCYLSDAEIGIA